MDRGRTEVMDQGQTEDQSEVGPRTNPRSDRGHWSEVRPRTNPRSDWSEVMWPRSSLAPASAHGLSLDQTLYTVDRELILDLVSD